MNTSHRRFAPFRLLISAAFLFAAAFAQADIFEIEIAPGYTQVLPGGTLDYKGLASLDLQTDLGFDKKDAFTARLKAELPLVLPNIYLVASPLQFSGSGSRNVPFQFGDFTYNANVPYTATLRLDRYDAALFYNVPFLKKATDDILDAEFGLNLRFVDFHGEILQPATGLRQSKSQVLPVPMGYVALWISPLDSFTFGGEVRGIAYGQNRYVDLTGRAYYRFLKYLFVSGGYRFENLKIDSNDIRADLRFGGPVAELGFRF